VTSPTYPASTIAKLLDLTERRVRQLASEGIIPKAAGGRYDLVASVRGYVRHLRTRGIGEGTLDAHSERARLTRLKADREELELAQLRGELVPVDEAAALLEKVIVACRSRILAIPNRAAPLVSRKRKAAEVREILTRITDEALHELAAIDVDSLGGHGEAAAVDAPAPADGQRVGGPGESP